MLRWLPLLLVAACFSVPDYGSGDLVCDDGSCPPGYRCGADQRCRKPGGVVVDAPLSFDGPSRDGAPVDASPVDAVRVFDAMPCVNGERRCVVSVLQICVDGSFMPSVPSCVSMGQDCFDPAPAGGSDAYCGTCLKGSKRCTATAVQTCPSSGVWTDETPCAQGCFDGGSAPYCRECNEGDRRCNGNTLQTCTDGRWGGDSVCGNTAGFSCFDPAPAGGSDAYCGACVKNEIICRGDSRDQCNSDGSGYVTIEACSFGCNGGSATCCAMPTCDTGQICGNSAANACGRRVSCGPCNGTCCSGGELCCRFGGCCDTVCCGSGSSCCEPGICSSGPCP